MHENPKVAMALGDLTSRPIKRYRRAVFAVPVLGLACAAASVGIVAANGPIVTTYAAASPRLAAAALTPAMLLVLTGCAAAVLRVYEQVGSLPVLVGIGWLAPIWVGWRSEVAGVPGAALMRSIGMVAVPLLVPLVLHLTLALTRAPLGGTRMLDTRMLVGAGYAAAVVAAVG